MLPAEAPSNDTHEWSCAPPQRMMHAHVRTSQGARSCQPLAHLPHFSSCFFPQCTNAHCLPLAPASRLRRPQCSAIQTVTLSGPSACVCPPRHSQLLIPAGFVSCSSVPTCGWRLHSAGRGRRSTRRDETTVLRTVGKKEGSDDRKGQLLGHRGRQGQREVPGAAGRSHHRERGLKNETLCHSSRPPTACSRASKERQASRWADGRAGGRAAGSGLRLFGAACGAAARRRQRLFERRIGGSCGLHAARGALRVVEARHGAARHINV